MCVGVRRTRDLEASVSMHKDISLRFARACLRTCVCAYVVSRIQSSDRCSMPSSHAQTAHTILPHVQLAVALATTLGIHHIINV